MGNFCAQVRGRQGGNAGVPRLGRKRGKSWQGPERRSKVSETYGGDGIWQSLEVNYKYAGAERQEPGSKQAAWVDSLYFPRQGRPQTEREEPQGAEF